MHTTLKRPSLSQANESQPLIGGYVNDKRLTVRDTRRKVITLAVAAVVFILCFRLLVATSVDADVIFARPPRFRKVTPPIDLPGRVKHSWAQYAPFRAVEKYMGPPKGCIVTQANILQRHGARYPNEDDVDKIQTAIKKLKGADSYKDTRLKFLKEYELELGAEDLVSFGAAQSYDSGQLDYARYRHLANKTTEPFVRASGKGRVVDSATNWTAGFSFASRQNPAPSVGLIIPENDKFNNTLNDDSCPAAGQGTDEMDTWESIYATPVAERLNTLAPGANLTAGDVSILIMHCALETLAHARPGERVEPSPFCALFDQKELDGFEYMSDIEKYYKTGYGNALGPVQGLGYVNELLARLTGQSVRDHTQTNRTLDASPATFPLNRTMYADFTHENLMIAVYSAMGLFHIPHDLNPTKMDADRGWRATRMVPFSARMVVERVACEGVDGTFVRVLVNDAVQSMELCRNEQSTEEMCTLESFVQSQVYARSGGDGDFEKCFKD